MRTIRVYRIAADKLKKKGLRTVMMRPHQLVFSPHSCMGGAWLTFYKEKWHLGTWAPHVYRIFKKSDIAPLCKDFIATKSLAIVTPELLEKYHLIKISDSEMELMFDDQAKSSK